MENRSVEVENKVEAILQAMKVGKLRRVSTWQLALRKIKDYFMGVDGYLDHFQTHEEQRIIRQTVIWFIPSRDHEDLTYKLLRNRIRKLEEDRTTKRKSK